MEFTVNVMAIRRLTWIRRMSLLVAILALAQVCLGATFLPPFALPTLDGGVLTNDDFQGNVAIGFVLPDCPACKRVLAWLQSAEDSYSEIRFALVTFDESEAFREALRADEVTLPVILDEEMLLASLLQAYRAPTVYTFYNGRLIDRLGWRFAEEDLISALDTLVEGVAIPWPTKLEAMFGKAAPQFTGSSVSGKEISLSNVPKPLLLAFLGANCPYCHAMLPELFSIAESYPVCFVVTGETIDPSEFEAEGTISLTVVLDPEWEIASSYEAASVPTVFLVDEEGFVVWIGEGYLEGLGVSVKAMWQASKKEE